MKTRTSRRIVVLLAAAALALIAAWLFFDWERLAVRWQVWRLEQARDFEEARPCLEAIAARCQSPAACELALAKLSEANLRYSFWVFEYLSWELPGDRETRRFGSPHLGPLYPFVRGFVSRLRRDEPLLATFAHYVRWKAGGEFWTQLDGMVDQHHPPLSQRALSSVIGAIFASFFSGLAADIEKEILSYHERHPEVLEAAALVALARMLARGWTVGLSAAEVVPEADALTGIAAVERCRPTEIRLARWVYEHQERLVFDPALGRCRVLPPAESRSAQPRFSERGIATPSDPLPSWRGPVPEASRR